MRCHGYVSFRLQVKSMLLLAPKLSETLMDNQLLRHFAKMQMDEQPEIRTNTTICLGKIATHLSAATRQRVLVTAFARSMKDPFNHARVAGLMAFGATHKYLTSMEVATKVFPCVVPLSLDTDAGVRQQAIALSKTLLARLENGPHDAETSSKTSSAQDSSTFTTGWSWASSALSVVSSTVSRGSKQGTEPASAPAPGADAADATDEDGDDDDDEALFQDAAEIPSDLGRGSKKKLGKGPLKLAGSKIKKARSSGGDSTPRYWQLRGGKWAVSQRCPPPHTHTHAHTHARAHICCPLLSGHAAN